MGNPQPKKLTPEEFQKLFLLIENTKWQYKLDQYSDAAMGEINRSVFKARKDVGAKLQQSIKLNLDLEDRARLTVLAEELQDMTVAVQAQITGEINAVAVDAGLKAYVIHNGILSVGNRVLDFNHVALSASQLENMIVKTPVGGRLLNEWVETAFSSNLQEKFKDEITAGFLTGESYKNILNRFETKAFKGIQNDIEGLTRTYIQSVNVQAADDVMSANKDIIKGWKWSSVAENRTCLRCLSLDAKEKIYKTGEGPAMPLHPRCRCFKEPITKTWRELGIDIDEMSEAYKPYTVRGQIDPVTGKLKPGKIGVGGGKTISVGRFLGTYDAFFQKVPATVQKQILGPARYGLWKTGKVKLSGLADEAGNLRLIDELKE